MFHYQLVIEWLITMMRKKL